MTTSITSISVNQTPAEPALSVKPLRIGQHEFWPPVLPAPMCGISDRAWRAMSREQGCPLVFTQMVSSEAMIRGKDRCWNLLDMDDSEKPICAQVFGSDPDALAQSARMIQDAGASIVDLNMGCPVNKVVNQKGGSALMREPDLVREIFRKMRAALTVPFTVKFRAGWDKYGDEAFVIAHLAEEEGLDAIAIHGRTREQKFDGKADWSILGEMKKVVKIPVIGNGDVKSADDAVRMFRETGVDGVMIGRGAMGNPWLFGKICARLAGQPEPPDPTPEERLDTVARHVQIMFERKGPRGVIEFRKHAVQYLRGFHAAKLLKTHLLNVTDIDDYLKAIEQAKLDLAAWEESAPEAAEEE